MLAVVAEGGAGVSESLMAQGPVVGVHELEGHAPVDGMVPLVFVQVAIDQGGIVGIGSPFQGAREIEDALEDGTHRDVDLRVVGIERLLVFVLGVVSDMGDAPGPDLHEVKQAGFVTLAGHLGLGGGHAADPFRLQVAVLPDMHFSGVAGEERLHPGRDDDGLPFLQQQPQELDVIVVAMAVGGEDCVQLVGQFLLTGAIIEAFAVAEVDADAGVLRAEDITGTVEFEELQLIPGRARAVQELEKLLPLVLGGCREMANPSSSSFLRGSGSCYRDF